MDLPFQVVFFLAFLAVVLFCFAFWVWMLIHSLMNEAGSDKVAWVIVIVMLPVLGSLIYFFVRVLGRREHPRTP